MEIVQRYEPCLCGLRDWCCLPCLLEDDFEVLSRVSRTGLALMSSCLAGDFLGDLFSALKSDCLEGWAFDSPKLG